MVNGNYMVYGDRPVSESEIVDDHVHTRTAERRAKRKLNRSANDLQRTLNMAQLDNDTDSVKYEKKTKEPKLLRYVPTTDVEEHFVNENFETYDVKLEETPRRYAFTKKPKNPTDGSVHYAYSRSSSSCSSPGGNLPTIAEHVEQYGTYRVRAPPSPTDIDILKSFNNNNNFNNNKLDKYFVKPKEVKKYAAKGSHPDSLYRVAPGSGTGGGKVARVLRLLRWPAALVIVCMALAVFVYFLMPDSIDSDSDIVNGTYWENNGAGAQSQHTRTLEPDKTVLPMKPPEKKPSRTLHHGTSLGDSGTKTTEIDFYDVESEKTVDIQSILDKLRDEKVNRKLPIAPVFPTHISPEVQYGNEKADVDKLRSPKLLVDDVTVLPLDSTLRPHITQHPEKPLAIYFNKDTTTSTETLTEVQTSSNFVRHDNNKTNNAAELDQEKQGEREEELNSEPEPPPEIEFENVKTIDSNMNFTSGHSKLFGISIEDAEKMKSTTQSALYNTKVSPTLPVWRDDDDTTTLKYPVNSPEGQPQCRSTRLGLCRGILPYDLAMMTATSPAGVDLASLLPQIEYLVASNCSDRVKHFVCALLEPECSAPLNQPKLPCYSLCQAIIDNCDGGIPRELASTFDCRRYPASDCWGSNPPCYLREIQCSDGSCVPRDYICDGKRDCPAGEDESQCVQCSRYEFRCPRDSICIQKQWVCDGYADCPSGDDETEASCAEIGVAAPRAEPTQGELGEEIAGSAPEPSVRRPNRLPSVANDKDVNSHRAEYESSKELLMTSDSSNGLRRNYTRRPKPSQRLNMYNQEPVQKEMIKDEAPKPEDQEENPEYRVENTQYSRFRGQTPVDQTDSKLDIVYARGNPSRLTPYSRPKPIGENIVESKQPSSTSRFTKTEDKNYRRQGSSKPKTKQGDEDATAINVGDLNFDAKEPGKENLAQTAQSPDKVSSSLSHLDKTINKLERILNGAALLSKAQKDLDKDATPPPDDYDLARENMTRTDPEMTTKGFASDEQPISSHASPCPSGELRCVDGRCITLAQLCDGTIDCSDHADEDNCYT